MVHGLGDGFRTEVAGEAMAAHQARIGLAKLGLDGVERHIGKSAAIVQIFHMLTAGAIERLQQRIGLAVELERLQPDPVAQRAIESGRRLDPAAGQIKLGVRMPEKCVGFDFFIKRGEVRWLRTSAKPTRAGMPITRAQAANSADFPMQKVRPAASTPLAR